MNILILLAALCVSFMAGFAAVPRLLVPAGPSEWTGPVVSADGLIIAFSDASHTGVRVLVMGEDTTRGITRIPGAGYRYVFEPGNQDRVVYRQPINSLPGRPEALFSVSPYLYDATMRNQGAPSKIYGPYLIEQKVWYRRSLNGPFLDYSGNARVAGPYLDSLTKSLTVKNEAGEDVFASPMGHTFGAMEVSPDGQWVAAVRTQPAVALLLIHVSDGTVWEENNAADPGWSGDSRMLICVRSIAPGPPELYRMRVPGGPGETVLRNPDFDPETPILNVDGTRVIFVSKGSIYDLDIMP